MKHALEREAAGRFGVSMKDAVETKPSMRRARC